ncbi:MAG: Rieske 2Fe-2S domain-containing protein [SAR202 cluster bacterium]|nr:Rieske 2Fe-2S domain-containing protein [SAR202 cluster bacterium]
MLTVEDNKMLTQTGPGTPMGELFRRFWLPVMLSEEIPAADGPPKRLRIMSEDLIAFRDSNGEVGILDAYCPHRGAPLFFGRNEECGLRCVYHGWKFDVNGVCVDLPNSPEGETYKDKVSIKSYPGVDKGGVIWAYMGPKDKQPPLPELGFMSVPASHRYVWRMELECNYFQSMEGDIDSSHVNFLHSVLGDVRSNPQVRHRDADPDRLTGTVPQYVHLEDTEYGVGHVTVVNRGDGTQMVNTGSWLMPCFTLGSAAEGVGQQNIRVPIDDEHCQFYRIRHDIDAPLTEKELWECKHSNFVYPPLIPGTFTPTSNKHNDYQIDRVMQKNFNFTGIRSFSTQDTALIEDQRGAIMDRNNEHLVTSDNAIIQIRKRLLGLARDLMEGKEPPTTSNPNLYHMRSRRFNVPQGEDVLEEAVSYLAPAGS